MFCMFVEEKKCCMRLFIKDIAKIRTGVFGKNQANPDLFYIQGNDFDSARRWLDHLKPALVLEGSLNKHVLQEGDVLFVAKGREFFAVAYDCRYHPAVASGTFLILEVDKDKVVSAFLTWYLNHPKTNELLKQLSRGSSMPMISKSTLGGIEIKIPSIDVQRKILYVSSLQERQNSLTEQLQSLKNNRINELLYKNVI